MRLIITIIIAVVGLFFSYGNDTTKKRFFFVVFCALLVVVQITFRDIDYHMSSNNDTVRYFYMFENMKSTPFIIDSLSSIFKSVDSYEERSPGFDILIKAFQLVSKDFIAFLFFTSLIIVVPISMFIYRYSKNIISIALSYVILEFFFEGFFETGIRQSIALGMTLCCYPLLLKGRIKMYVLLIFIISSIHTTVLIVLPIIVSKYVKNIKKSKLLLAMLLLIPVLFVYLKTITEILGRGSIYERYLINSENNLGTPVYSFFVVVVTLLFIIIFKKIAMQEKDYKVITIAIISSLILMPLSWVDSNLLRLSFYYSVFYVVVIPMIFNLLSIKFRFSYNKICFVTMAFLIFMLQR